MTRNILTKIIVLIIGLFILNLNSVTLNAVSCNASNIRWNAVDYAIEVAGDVQCTLTDIKTFGHPDLPLYRVDDYNKIWYLAANLYMVQGAQLYLTGGDFGDVNELRLMSANNGQDHPFVILSPRHGLLEIRNTKIYSHDPATNSYDLDVANGRANIQAISFIDDEIVYESTMNIYDSDIGYLGYLAGESYGLSWKVKEPPEMLDIINVYGTVENTVIHHNYYGAYSFGAEAMVWRNNEFRDNIQYGLDPHDDSDNLIIENNYAHHNGNHGIICSKRCNNLIIRNNVANYNVGHGIMLHLNVDYSVVENNEANYNTIAGIALYDSHHNTIRNNTMTGNAIGIRVNAGSSFNVFEENTILESTENGIYFYAGSSEPTTINNGRPTNNEISNNTISNGAGYGIRLKDSETTTISHNVIENNNKGIFVYGESPIANTITFNTFTNNTDYGITLRDVTQANVSNNTIQQSRVGIKLETSSDNTIVENMIAENRYGIQFTTTSHNNLVMGNTINENESAIEIDASNNTILRSNQMVDNQDNYVYIGSASINTRIEDMANASVRLGDAESTAQVTDSSGYLLYSSNNLVNHIQNGVVQVTPEFVDSSRIISIRRMNIVIETDDSFTFTPSIWNNGDFNIIAWQLTTSEVSSASFTISSLESGSEYNLLINGSSWDTFVVPDDGIITFDYPEIQSNTFALIRVNI